MKHIITLLSVGIAFTSCSNNNKPHKFNAIIPHTKYHKIVYGDSTNKIGDTVINNGIRVVLDTDYGTNW